MEKIEFSFVLPAYNEQENIEEAIKQANTFLKKRFDIYEIIVVDDGSKDDTRNIVKKIASSNRFVKVISHDKNKGYGATVWNGLRQSKGELIFFTDSDLQFDINELDVFIKEIKKSDVVIGYRRRRSEGLPRAFNAMLWRMVAFAFLSIKYKDIDCAFKLFRKNVIASINVGSEGATFSAELLYKLKKSGFRIVEKPVRHFKRKFGTPTGAKMAVILKSFAEIYSFYKTEPSLVRSRSIVLFCVAIALLFVSRIIFLGSSADFFDSMQYIARTAEADFLKALTNGHAPFHPLYIFFSNIFYKLRLASDPALSAQLVSAVLGSLSIIVFFQIAKKLFDNKIAWLSSIIYAIFPFVCVSQITILVDPTMHLFFYLSLYLFILAIENISKPLLYIFSILAGLSLSLGALAHTQVAFWTVAFISTVIIKLPEIKSKDVLRFIIALFLLALFSFSSIFVYSQLLIYSDAKGYIDMGINSLTGAIDFLLFGNVGDRSAISFAEYLRRFSSVSSIIVIVLSLCGLILMLAKNKYRYALALALWILPPLLTSSYIYENLHGRAMMMSLAPLAFLIGYLSLKTRKIGVILYVIVLAQLLVLSIPQVAKYKVNQAPNESLSQMQKDSDGGGIFVSSNVTRTWSSYDGEFVNFGDVGVGAGDVYKKSLQALANDKPAYLSSDAIYHPRWRFDGEYFDIRSSGAGGASDHPTLLFEVFTKLYVNIDRASDSFKQSVYKIAQKQDDRILEKIAEISRNKPVVFGQIKSNGRAVSNLSVNLYEKRLCQINEEDITRLDFVRCAIRSLKYRSALTNWSFTDRGGWFYVAEDVKSPQVILGAVSSETRSDYLEGVFAKQTEIDITSNNFQRFENISEFRNVISDNNDSFYAIASFDDGKIVFDYYKIDFGLESSTRIEGENLSGEIGKTVNYAQASNDEAKYTTVRGIGYLTSGPYVDLPKGRYEVVFYAKVGDSLDNASPVLFDVSSGSLGLGRKEVPPSDLQGEFKKVSIEFELLEDAQAVEFRTRCEGGSEVFLDYIELNRL